MNVLSIGEILWDCFPDQETLGGAPLNFATDLHRLGDHSILVSAVGKDHRGERALQTMLEIGLSIDYIPALEDVPTGVAMIEVSPNGEPKFSIPRPAAFDRIALSEKVIDQISHLGIDWLYFGTLAQMGPEVEQVTANLSKKIPAVRCLYDMNLRKDNWDIEKVKRLCRLATVLKLNEAEAKTMFELSETAKEQFSLEAFCSAWTSEYDLDAICVTLGATGCCIYERGVFTTCGGYPAQVVDTVGAGDAFAAGFLYGYHRGWPTEKTARFANAIGAIVASHAGATPPLTLEECGAVAFSSQSV